MPTGNIKAQAEAMGFQVVLIALLLRRGGGAWVNYDKMDVASGAGAGRTRMYTKHIGVHTVRRLVLDKRNEICKHKKRN